MPVVTEMPTVVSEGDIVHYLGDNYYEGQGEQRHLVYATGAFYLYENENWVQVFAKSMSVPTRYQYEVILTNESGYMTEAKNIIIEALCTNISDIVHSHEHYKDLYVEKLSAISANIGLISQGGMGSFTDQLNYWALSDLSAEDSGIAGGIKKGSFRVGGTDQYFLVEPSQNDPSKYTITLRAGNINLTTEQNKDSTTLYG